MFVMFPILSQKFYVPPKKHFIIFILFYYITQSFLRECKTSVRESKIIDVIFPPISYFSYVPLGAP